MRQAVLSRAITRIEVAAYVEDAEKFSAATFKPRGWSWVDPTKEVDAYEKAVRCGFTTVSDVIAATGNGRDIEDVIRERRRELDMLAAADIKVDTTVEEGPEPAPAQDVDDDGEPAARVVAMRAR
jgi:capsid protein